MLNRTQVLHDADGIKYTVHVKLQDGKLSMSADYSSGGGQCQDSIKPANADQTRLLEIWNEWHLNDMHDKQLPATLEEELSTILSRIGKAEQAREDERKDLSDDDKLIALMDEQGIDESMFEACKAYMDVMSVDDLDNFEESYQGEYGSDEQFAQELAEQIGAIDDDAKWPLTCIDWEHASRELMYDYTEQDGYYFRNL